MNSEAQPFELAPDQEQRLLAIARRAVTQALMGRGLTAVEPGPGEAWLQQRAGCFVTLHHRHGRLRGCIGTFKADRPLAENLVSMSAAVTRDPRFVRADPVVLAEANDLVIEVSLITPLQPAPDPLAMRVGTDGLCIRGEVEGRSVSGCYLPQVAVEQGWTAEQTLAQCCTSKMGLDPDAWRGEALSCLFFQATVVREVAAEAH